MQADQVARVRDFNRFHTQHLGVLTDRYLGQDRPLGQARLLYEIGAGCDVRDLRERLGLDSGYLSRLLRALADEQLVTVRAHPADGRVRIAELTEAGRAERADLDRRSAQGIADLLAGLTAAQREDLLATQARLRRLLRLATITIAATDPAGPDAQDCLARYAAELAARFPEGYDPAALTAPGEIDGTMLLAAERGRPAGCGLWVHAGAGAAEIRHLWVAPAARGLGLGRRLLHALENDAAGHGRSTVRLGTHHTLAEAQALYESSGYRPGGGPTSAYNQITFTKDLHQSS